MNRFIKFHRPVSVKLSFMILLILASVAGIAAVNLLSSRHVEGLLIKMTDRDVTQIIDNARLGREFSRVFAQINVLINTFPERGETLKVDSDRLMATLHRTISAVKYEEENAQETLREFSRKLQSLFDHCVEVNGSLGDIRAIDNKLNTVLENLDDAVAEKRIAVTAKGTGNEASAIDQLSIRLSVFRELLYQVAIQFIRSTHSHLSTKPVEEDYERQILSLLEEFETGLTAMTTTWEDIDPLVRQLVETVLQYKEHITALHTDMREFQARFDVLENAQEMVMVVMGEIEKQISESTVNIRKTITTNIKSSETMIISLSAAVIFLLVIIGYYATKKYTHDLELEIKERKQTEEALQQAHRELELRAAAFEEANEELSQYAYVVSHDLKAPLRAIHNYADFLREDLEGSLDGDQRAYLDGLGRAVRQGEELVEDLLEHCRIGTRSGPTESIDMGVFLQELIGTLELSPDVEVVMGDDWPAIDTDPILLWQIFQNLISNAIKFNGSARKRIEIGRLPAGEERCELFVRDNGIGIESRYHEQIFRVFQRLHTSEEYEGTGIGLAIVRKVSSRLQGSVRLESKPGEGSTFFVALPRRIDGNCSEF